MNAFLQHASDTRYRSTPAHECQVSDYRVPIAERFELVVHIEAYKQLIRKFSIELHDLEGNIAARIDTAHSCVHRHQFYRDADEDYPYHFIARVENGIVGAKTVQEEFEPAFALLEAHADMFYRRWQQ